LVVVYAPDCPEEQFVQHGCVQPLPALTAPGWDGRAELCRIRVGEEIKPEVAREQEGDPISGVPSGVTSRA